MAPRACFLHGRPRPWAWRSSSPISCISDTFPPHSPRPGRRPSLECRAAQEGPERPREALPTDSGIDWDLDASTMPWTAGLHRLEDAASEEAPDTARRPLVFYPAAQSAGAAEDAPRASPWPTDAHTPCYVILFGVGEEDVEGIYTLRTTDPADADAVTSVDTVVAFESEVDAQRFATLLEASLAYKPCVYPISWADVTEWCEDSNTRCRLEPAGSLLIPPESNVERTDWERSLALQRGEYRVLDAEPAVGGADEAADPVFGPPTPVYAGAGSFYDQLGAWAEEEAERDEVATSVDCRILAADLADIRAELERLLDA